MLHTDIYTIYTHSRSSSLHMVNSSNGSYALLLSPTEVKPLEEKMTEAEVCSH